MTSLSTNKRRPNSKKQRALLILAKKDIQSAETIWGNSQFLHTVVTHDDKLQIKIACIKWLYPKLRII
jgi:hypothetical protein